MKKILTAIIWISMTIDYKMVLACTGVALFALDAVVMASTGVKYMPELAMTNAYIGGVICIGLLLLNIINNIVVRIFEES